MKNQTAPAAKGSTKQEIAVIKLRNDKDEVEVLNIPVTFQLSAGQSDAWGRQRDAAEFKAVEIARKHTKLAGETYFTVLCFADAVSTVHGVGVSA